MKSQPNLPTQQNTEDEIDLIALAKTVWNGRKTILIFIVIGSIMGVLIALTSPKEYTASTVMVPQWGDSQSGLGGLSGLAELAGYSFDTYSGDELSPMIYPQIVSSVPFQMELMNTPLNFQEYPMPITLFDYYTKYGKTTFLGTVKKYTIGLPGLMIKAIKGKGKSREISLPGDSVNQPVLLTKAQYNVTNIIDGIVSLNVNNKEWYLTLTTQMPEPLAAAQLAQKAQLLLQKTITEFKIKKAKADLDFIQGRYDEAKAEFEKAQVSLAVVTDRNRFFTSGLPQIVTDRSQARYNIAFSVFQDLAQQLEQAKIQVKKDTPVFTIVEPVIVPYERSKPKKPRIIAIWFILGGITGVGIVFGKGFLKDLRTKWKESE
jgi:LPS O-antigen subunit length determinant protein (WzzB/FepE family)